MTPEVPGDQLSADPALHQLVTTRRTPQLLRQLSYDDDQFFFAHFFSSNKKSHPLVALISVFFNSLGLFLIPYERGAQAPGPMQARFWLAWVEKPSPPSQIQIVNFGSFGDFGNLAGHTSTVWSLSGSQAGTNPPRDLNRGCRPFRVSPPTPLSDDVAQARVFAPAG